MGGLPTKVVLCSKNAVFAAVIELPTIAEIEAGEPPIMAAVPPTKPVAVVAVVQFCAKAPDALNSEAATARAAVVPIKRPEEYQAPANRRDSPDVCLVLNIWTPR